MDDVRRAQWRLLAELAAGAVVSGGVGVVARRIGRQGDNRFLRAFGRQTIAWAAVDAGIVAWGVANRGGAPGDDESARTLARRMRLLTGASALADAGFVAAGVAVARRWPARRGDGVAIVLQGLFLAWLDARHARGFHTLTRG